VRGVVIIKVGVHLLLAREGHDFVQHAGADAVKVCLQEGKVVWIAGVS
jgi:hypothetical protein